MAVLVNVFKKPEGEVRGIANSMRKFNGKDRRCAHATLLTGGRMDITVERCPKLDNPESLREYARELLAFADAVEAA